MSTFIYLPGDVDSLPVTPPITGIPAVVDGSVAAAGQIGEIISSSVAVATTTNVAATGVWGFVTSVALTAGVWRITGVVGFNENAAVLTTSMSAGISATNNAAAIAIGDFCQYNNLISGTADLIAAAGMPFDVSIAAPANYFLNSRFFYTSGTPKHYGKIKAVRVG